MPSMYAFVLGNGSWLLGMPSPGGKVTVINDCKGINIWLKFLKPKTDKHYAHIYAFKLHP